MIRLSYPAALFIPEIWLFRVSLQDFCGKVKLCSKISSIAKLDLGRQHIYIKNKQLVETARPEI